jgi:hypothetical protein
VVGQHDLKRIHVSMVNGVWLVIILQTCTKKTCVEKKLRRMLNYFLTILDAIFNIVGGMGPR